MFLSKPASNQWTWTMVQTHSLPVHHYYLHCSPEGELLMIQELVGETFTILRENTFYNRPVEPALPYLEAARRLTPVQTGRNHYTAAYLLSNGRPQLPLEKAEEYHAVQKSDGSWCFLPKPSTKAPQDWESRRLAPPRKPSPPAAQPAPVNHEQQGPILDKQPEPKEPKTENQSKQSNASTANDGNEACTKASRNKASRSGNGACTEVSQSEASRSGNSGDHGNSPITNLPNYPIPSPTYPIPDHPPSDVLDFLESTISEYLVCSPAQRSVLALWILHTYTFQAAHFTPYLNIYSPLEESGKSTCMAILRSFCARPWWAAGGSPAIVKRTILADHPTVLLDNWHTVFRGSDKNQFTGFLLNGCDQAHDVASFDSQSEKTIANLWQTFCPKAFAGLESLPPSLARHSIPIVLQRRKPLEIVKSTFNLLVPGSTDNLTSWMQRWAQDHEGRVAATFDSYELEGPILPSLSPHQQNCARALIALAETIGGHWPQKAGAALMEIFRNYNKGQVSPLQLLSDIRGAFVRRGLQERIFTAELLEDLHDLDDRTWHEYGKSGKPMTPQALSRILGPTFKIYSRSQRRGQEKLRGYQLSDFLEAWERYLPSQPTPAATIGEPAAQDSVSSQTVPQPGPDHVSANKTAPCLNVPLPKSNTAARVIHPEVEHAARPGHRRKARKAPHVLRILSPG